MTPPLHREAPVSVTGLVKNFGSTIALSGVTFDVGEGEVFGLLGPNGAGKTTTIETIVGMLAPTRGHVRVFGRDPYSDRGLRHIVGVQPQEAALLPRQTVGETLRLWSSFYRNPADTEEIITSLGLSSCRDMRIDKLSGGQRRRVLIATALVPHPRLLVLDEPSSGLDPRTRRALWEVIRDRCSSGTTVLLSTHSMEEAQELCDRVALVDGGTVVACGTVDELVRAHASEEGVSARVSSAEATELVSLLPEALEVESRPVKDGFLVHVRTGFPDDLIAAMLASPIGAREIKVHGGRLDSVFVNLTGHGYQSDESG